MSRDYKIPKGTKYTITIEKTTYAGKERFNYSAGKHYGNCHYNGYMKEITKENLERVLQDIERIIGDWQGHDGILQRMGDKVTRDNLFFSSDFPELTFADIAKFLLPEGQKTILEAST
ncbi:MAG: hypothetical protein KO464_05635 [Candidatus Methanofastidiosum sp.]|nr:hypothetical protein [Methanofastidiosum sp.]